ncbi:MAG TPA: FAD:protein FMN transferase [Bacteroidales bacterium]|nr:FAD:protein FMN transferase [Bacteroidales bacterium]
MKSKLSYYLVFLWGLLILNSCQDKKYFRNEGFVFGTTYHITYAATEDLQPGMEAEMEKFNNSLSTYTPSSTISRFNRSRSEPFDLRQDPWMLKMIQESLHFSELTNGAFDITVGPLVDLWGFGTKTKSNPTAAQIDSIRSFVSYKLLKLEDDKLLKFDPRIQLDCGAIAGGYASDIIADYLRSHGVDDFMVEIGGEVVLSGKNPEGKKWRIGINKPIDDSTSNVNEIERLLLLTDKALSTSGNYRSFYVKDGKKYAHTIDPQTGYPVQHSLLSATIVANDCFTADALATACMVIGVDSSMTLIESLHRKGVEAFFIYNEGGAENKVKYTPGFESFLEKE